MAAIFYVYEHWRPDRDECFYVGKGKKNRAYVTDKRNAHHKAIRQKLERLGMAFDIKIVASGLSEDEAFNIERERIAFWRSQGNDLANMTDGGEGFTGGRHGKFVRDRMSKNRTGHATSEETRKKISEALKGRSYSKETIKKMKLAQKKRATPEKMKELSTLALKKRWGKK